MIFWKARGKEKALLIAFRAECAYWDVPAKTKDTPVKVSLSFTDIGGSGFVEWISFVDEEKIVIYQYFNQFVRNYKIKELIYFVREDEDLEKIPDSVAVRTSNIDFIRELFSRGKKVTWVEPDLVNLYPFLSKFNFHHLFLNCFSSEYLFLPNGEVISRDNLKRWICNDNKIGYHLLDLKDPVIFYSRRLKGSTFLRFSYYNFLSLTYVIWQQSTVMNVKKKPAHKDLLDQFVL